jgi:hypothetical protein
LEESVSASKNREIKYQALRLYNSGQISLRDLKATFRIVTSAAFDEYSSSKDQTDAIGTKDRLEKIRKLTMTRSEAILEKQLAMKVKPRLARNRAEEIAQFTTSYKTGIPANFSRYGILRAKGKRKAKPRIGSSEGKYARTTYKGFKEFNRRYDEFERALLQLVRTGNADRNKLQKRLGKIRAGVTTSATRRV